MVYSNYSREETDPPSSPNGRTYAVCLLSPLGRSPCCLQPGQSYSGTYKSSIVQITNVAVVRRSVPGPNLFSSSCWVCGFSQVIGLLGSFLLFSYFVWLQLPFSLPHLAQIVLRLYLKGPECVHGKINLSFL